MSENPESGLLVLDKEFEAEFGVVLESGFEFGFESGFESCFVLFSVFAPRFDPFSEFFFTFGTSGGKGSSVKFGKSYKRQVKNSEKTMKN